MGVVAFLSVTVPRLVPAPFSDSGEGTATDTAVPLLLIAAILQFFDCAQHIGVVMLRGLDDTRGGFGVTVVGHWLLGLLTGLATTAVLLLRRFKRACGPPELRSRPRHHVMGAAQASSRVRPSQSEELRAPGRA